MTARFTPKQGQYLAFIDYYIQVHRRAPAETDLREYFRVTAPTVHQMLTTLMRRGLISRVPGEARSMVLLIRPDELPPLARGGPQSLPSAFAANDWVQLVSAPPATKDVEQQLRRVLEFCVGRVYRVDRIGGHGELVLDVMTDAHDTFGYGGSSGETPTEINVAPRYVRRADARPEEAARRAFGGVWRITRMDKWDQDSVDLVVPGQVRFEIGSRLGSLYFIAVEGGLDCFYSMRDARPFVEFCWRGGDDGRPANGRGWATLVRDDELLGHLFFQQGMDSSFSAKRDKTGKLKIPRMRPSRRGPPTW